MTIARDIGRHARQAIIPVLGISLLTYFSYHAIQGERGLFAWIQLNQQLKQTRALADAVAGQRAELENRVRRLSSGSLDTDLLDERVRSMLNLARGDEVVIMLPQQPAADTTPSPRIGSAPSN
ncbi:MAG TPA: septum formation initiator family protein [Dongiaceae bacterium]|nr:septum formation initiator family protein [Dongiaceae bacterium]